MNKSYFVVFEENVYRVEKSNEKPLKIGNVVIEPSPKVKKVGVKEFHKTFFAKSEKELHSLINHFIDNKENSPDISVKYIGEIQNTYER